MEIDPTASRQDTLNPASAARVSKAIAITMVVSIATLALLYSGIPIFGPINDLTNVAGGLLSALLVWQFHILLWPHQRRLSTLILLSGWAGSTAIIISSLLVAFGVIGWKTGGMFTSLGLGLQGIWLFFLLQRIAPQPFLDAGSIRLGRIAATAMLFGFLGGPILAAEVNMLASPFTGLATLISAVGWLLYPLWCWLVGRNLAQLHTSLNRGQG